MTGIHLPQTKDEEVAAINALRALIPADVDSKLRTAGEEGVTDAFLLRWLIARKWVVKQAAADIIKHSDWAVQFKPTGEVPLERVQTDLSHHKFFVQGVSSSGRPFGVGIASRHIPHKPSEEIKHFVVWCLDAVIAYGNNVIGDSWDGKSDVAFDLSGLGYKNVDFAALPLIFTTLQNHYIERLGKLYICHAPLLFWGMWKVACPFLDPVTKEKIRFVTKDNEAEELGPLKELLPKELGGSAPLHPVQEVHQEVLALRQKGKAEAHVNTAANHIAT